MKNTVIQTAPPEIESLILEVRGHKVILDTDLALIYGVPTKRLNEQVKRNAARFPADFLFRLTTAEFEALRSQVAASANRSQIATGSQKHRDPRVLNTRWTTMLARDRDMRVSPLQGLGDLWWPLTWASAPRTRSCSGCPMAGLRPCPICGLKAREVRA